MRRGSWVRQPILRAFRRGCLIDGVDRNRGRVIAIKEVVAWQIELAMLKGNITRVEMAKRMRNSRAALNRLLGPANDAVTLLTL